MKIKDYKKIKAHVTFSKGVVRVFVEEGNYLVKFFRGEEFIGESEIGSLGWTSFTNDNKLMDWKIEFWSPEGGSIKSIHHHLLHGSDVLIVPHPKNTNQSMVEKVIEQCREAQAGGARCWVFFEGSYRFKDVLENEQIKILKFGQSRRIKFPFIIEKRF